MDIMVCIGSCCHIRGSYKIMNSLKEMISANGLEDSFTVKGTFCLGECNSGVTVKIGDIIVTDVTYDNLKNFFNEYITKY